ncbi:transposable element Tcb2 transposase [Trichonephila clavipes]|nr:transposable element Tcb2 transposase [Trichonephila clavipes]
MKTNENYTFEGAADKTLRLSVAFPVYRIVPAESLPEPDEIGRPQQTSRRDDCYIVRNARIQSTASSAAIQAQVATPLGAPASKRTIRRCLAEGHLGSRRPLSVLPLRLTHRHLHLEWCRARGNWTAAERNQVILSDESRFNLSSDNNRILVWRPVVNASILPLLYSDTPLPQMM